LGAGARDTLPGLSGHTRRLEPIEVDLPAHVGLGHLNGAVYRKIHQLRGHLEDRARSRDECLHDGCAGHDQASEYAMLIEPGPRPRR
jgi:hypothetical protein